MACRATSTLDSWVEINPKAAEALELQNGDLVWVESPLGGCRRRSASIPACGRTPSSCRPARATAPWSRWGRASARRTLVVGVNANSLAVASEPGVTRAGVYRSVPVPQLRACSRPFSGGRSCPVGEW